jgi:hypothetical protein
MVEGSGTPIVAEAFPESFAVKLLNPNAPSVPLGFVAPVTLIEKLSGWVIGAPRWVVIVAEPPREYAPEAKLVKVALENEIVRKLPPLATPPTVPPLLLLMVTVPEKPPWAGVVPSAAAVCDVAVTVIVTPKGPTGVKNVGPNKREPLNVPLELKVDPVVDVPPVYV